MHILHKCYVISGMLASFPPHNFAPRKLKATSLGWPPMSLQLFQTSWKSISWFKIWKWEHSCMHSIVISCANLFSTQENWGNTKPSIVTSIFLQYSHCITWAANVYLSMSLKPILVSTQIRRWHYRLLSQSSFFDQSTDSTKGFISYPGQ
jgi:hypothetical protein